MYHDNEYNRNIELAAPLTPKELRQIEKEMKFTYKQGIGELIYAMVTCRPDISFPLIKLSQYSTKPSRIHFEAVRDIYAYLKRTKTEGIYYWRKSPRTDLPALPPPTQRTDTTSYTPSEETQTTNGMTLTSMVDSDFAGDTKHRRSVTGIVQLLAGGAILYKTKFQDTVALSST